MSSELKMKTNVCDLSYLRSHARHSPLFVADVIGIFLDVTPGYLTEMKRCVSVNDWTGLQDQVHRLCASITYLGFPKTIINAVAEIDEYAAKQEHLELIPVLLLQVEQILNAAFLELGKDI